MKSFFVASVLSLLLIPCFSFADGYHAHAHHHAGVSVSRKARDTQPVNINQATAAQLATLSGIGPKKAGDIIAYRTAHGPFKTVDDLTHVKGIGAKSLSRLEAKNPGRLVVNTVKKMG